MNNVAEVVQNDDEACAVSVRVLLNVVELNVPMPYSAIHQAANHRTIRNAQNVEKTTFRKGKGALVTNDVAALVGLLVSTEKM